jgi:predicted DNA-binding transcriptional regulator YafY
MPSARYEHRETVRRLLRNGHALSYAQLTERFGVSRRQVRRVLNALREDGLPVRDRFEENEDAGRRKVFFLAPGDQAPEIPLADLDQREILALAVAAQAARSALGPTPLADPAEAAFAKLLEPVAPGVLSFEVEAVPRRWRFDGRGTAQIDPGIFASVREAMSAQKSLVIEYTNAQGTRSWDRKIDPYQLVVAGSSWIVVAYDHYFQDVVHFALPAIREAQVGEPFFGTVDRYVAEAHLRAAFGAFEGEETHAVELAVSAEAAESFRRTSYHHTQEIEAQEDGALVVRYEVAGLEEIAGFVLSFGGKVRASEPEALREMVAQRARRMAEAHGGASAEP